MQLLIINNHYYRDKICSRSIFPTTDSRLLAAIDYLHSRGWQFAGQELLTENELITDDNGAKYVLLTFDDGLKEQMHAFHKLAEKGIKALFFPSSKPLCHHMILDVHKLHYIRHHIPDHEILRLLPKDKQISLEQVDQRLLTEQYRYDDLFAAQVKYLFNFMLSNDDRHQLINALFLKNSFNETQISKDLYMDKDDIRTLACSSSLGSHSHSHVPLATLHADALLHELTYSKEILEDISQTTITGISYPYGGPSAVSAGPTTMRK